MDISKTIIPKSDQLNADDLVGGAKTIKIRDIKGGSDDAQPISLYFYGDNNKPYKPCKSMRRVLVQLWGADGLKFINRKITIYRDDTVKYAGVEVGGIRISHASHIIEPTKVLITVARSSRKPITIEPIVPVPLEDVAKAKTALKEGKTTIEKIVAYYDVTNEQLKELQDEKV